ncbi:MAG: P-loop NTPase [Pseudomonadales bacterium]
MSTIEKAAARLVKKRITESRADKQVDKVAPATTRESTIAKAVGSSADGLNETVQARDASRSSGLGGQIQTSASPVLPVVEEAPLADHEVEYYKSCELDFPWLSDNGFLVPGHKNHRQSQEFRRIKRPLLMNLQQQIAQNHVRPTNVIFVTSALPAEGKTFVSLNLALSLAGEVDRSVLLVDGDVAKGDLSRWMGIYEEPGLVDLLNKGKGRTSAESNVIETNVDRLSVMSCGKQIDNLDELYASQMMTSLIDKIATHSAERIVVVDGPPLLPTTEAAVLANLMGQTIVVVEANKTPQAAVEDAVAQLKNAQLISMLLNKVPQAQSEGYGYGYGYGYGSERAAGAPDERVEV